MRVPRRWPGSTLSCVARPPLPFPSRSPPWLFLACFHTHSAERPPGGAPTPTAAAAARMAASSHAVHPPLPPSPGAGTTSWSACSAARRCPRSACPSASSACLPSWRRSCAQRRRRWAAAAQAAALCRALASSKPQLPRPATPCFQHPRMCPSLPSLPQAGGTIRETETEVLVASIGGGMQSRRMQVAADLWAAGLKAEFGYKAAPKMPDQVGGAAAAAAAGCRWPAAVAAAGCGWRRQCGCGRCGHKDGCFANCCCS